MSNVFFITYGGRANDGNNYVKYKAIVHTADEAIAVINTWHSYGNEKHGEKINVNKATENEIRKMFREGLGKYPFGGARPYRSLRTTGCGAWSIVFSPALADTLEEHNRIYNEQRETAKQERKRLSEEYRQKRIAELNEQRRGWYHTEITVVVLVFAQHGNDYRTELTLSGNVIADSGADAFDKAMTNLDNDPGLLTHHGNMATRESIPDMTSSHDYSFEFLGVKTDDGYSVEKWNEWKEKGEI